MARGQTVSGRFLAGFWLLQMGTIAARAAMSRLETAMSDSIVTPPMCRVTLPA